MTEPKLPKRPNQGSAADCHYGKVTRGNTSGPSGGKVVRGENTPGRGTRGNGTTHNNVGR